MAKQPTTVLREAYNYLRHGAGWFLCTLAEVEIFGLSSVIQPNGKVPPLTEEQLSPYDSVNLPDFCVLLVRYLPPSLLCPAHRSHPRPQSATPARQAWTPARAS